MQRPLKQSSLEKWVTVATTPRFPLFSKLPIEIRLLIWELTIEPRIVEMKTCDKMGIYPIYSYPEVPALSVCRESRSTVIKAYPLALETWYDKATRFNFEIDTLYFSQSCKDYIHFFFDGLTKADVQQLRYIAIDMTMCEDWDLCFLPGNDDPELDLFQDALSWGIEQMVRLENVFEVYLLHHWAVHIDWLVGGNVKLHAKLPPHLNDPDLKIDKDLPGPSQFFEWAFPNSQPVFGVLDGLVTAPGAPHRSLGPRGDEDHFSWLCFEEGY